MGIEQIHHGNFSRRSLLKSFGAAGLLAGLPTGLTGAAFAKELEKFPKLRALIDGYVNDKKVSGMIAAIGFGDKPVQGIAAGTIALDSQKPVDLNTLWRAYSQTKPMTGMAIMMLIEDGRLTLDTPLSDILPEFANQRRLIDPTGDSLDSVPVKTPITMRHLLTHTAGLGYSIISKGAILKEYMRLGITPGQVSKKPIPGFSGGAPVPEISEFSKRLATLPLVYEPGTTWSYSISIDLLGYVVQVVSGMPLETFLQNRMFGPLGMKNSFFQVPADRLSDLSTNYAVFAGSLIPIDPANDSVYSEKPAFAYGGAGLVCSAYDYDRFLAMLVGFGTLDGVQVMKTETAKLGMSNILPETVDSSHAWLANGGFGAGGRVGLGAKGGAPAGTYGWGGAAGTAGFVDTARGIRAGGYTQYMPSNAYKFQQAFPGYVYEDLLGMAGTATAEKTSA